MLYEKNHRQIQNLSMFVLEIPTLKDFCKGPQSKKNLTITKKAKYMKNIEIENWPM